MNYIWVKNKVIGFHNYPDAPENVAFLRETHRHVFHIKTSIEVFHNDRDIEFFTFQTYINSILPKDGFDFGPMSCEEIGDKVADFVNRKYPARMIFVEVSEDGENGSSKLYPPHKW